MSEHVRVLKWRYIRTIPFPFATTSLTAHRSTNSESKRTTGQRKREEIIAELFYVNFYATADEHSKHTENTAAAYHGNNIQSAIITITIIII